MHSSDFLAGLRKRRRNECERVPLQPREEVQQRPAEADVSPPAEDDLSPDVAEDDLSPPAEEYHPPLIEDDFFLKFAEDDLLKLAKNDLSPDVCRQMDELTLGCLEESDCDECVDEERQEATWPGYVWQHCIIPSTLNSLSVVDNVSNCHLPQSQDDGEEEATHFDESPADDAPEIAVHSLNHYVLFPPTVGNEQSKAYNWFKESSKDDLDNRYAVRKPLTTTIPLPRICSPKRRKRTCRESDSHALLGTSISLLQDEECSSESKGTELPWELRPNCDVLGIFDSLVPDDPAGKFNLPLLEERQPLIAVVSVDLEDKKEEEEAPTNRPREGDEADNNNVPALPGAGRAAQPTRDEERPSEAERPRQPWEERPLFDILGIFNRNASRQSSVSLSEINVWLPLRPQENTPYRNSFEDHVYSNTCPHLTPFECDPRNPCPPASPLPPPPPMERRVNRLWDVLAAATLALRMQTRLEIPRPCHLAEMNPQYVLEMLLEGHRKTSKPWGPNRQRQSEQEEIEDEEKVQEAQHGAIGPPEAQAVPPPVSDEEAWPALSKDDDKKKKKRAQN